MAMSLVLNILGANYCQANTINSEPSKNFEEFRVNTEEFEIKNDKSLLQFEKIKKLYQQTYWAKNWSEEKIQKNIDNSQLCYAVYDSNNNQIGFTRVVTDFSTVAYLLDVIIDEPYRKKGIGTKLIKAILENEDLKDCSFVLATFSQAISFYEKLGFQVKNEKYMLFRHIY